VRDDTHVGILDVVTQSFYTISKESISIPIHAKTGIMIKLIPGKINP